MAASARSFWKGYLQLALVMIPIRLVSAASAEERISLHQVDRKSKQRIRYLKVAGESGEPVQQKDIVSGYELEDGSYVLFEGDELDALKLSTRHTLELTTFAKAEEIEPIYFDRPYYVLPDGDVAEEGYRVIRDALRTSKKCGIGQLTMRGRENLVALRPLGNGLLAETLRYGNEVKQYDEIFDDIKETKLRAGLVEMAAKLIEERTARFDPSAYKNHYAEALRDLVREKAEGGKTVDVTGGRETGPPRGQVIDFMEALRRSAGEPKAAGTGGGGGHGERRKAAAASGPRPATKRSGHTPKSEGGAAPKKKKRATGR